MYVLPLCYNCYTLHSVLYSTVLCTVLYVNVQKSEKLLEIRMNYPQAGGELSTKSDELSTGRR